MREMAMRGGHQERGATRLMPFVQTAVLLCGQIFVLAGIVSFSGFADAADADRGAAPPGLTTSACQLMPRPEADIFGQVARFGPSWVCVSRGLYADRMPPEPRPPRPWWWW
jgi:hypothetical protein